MTGSPSALLTRLADADVDFVVIGAVAVVAHGHIRTTRDVDITYATDQANVERLGRVLVETDARLRGVAEVVPFIPDGRTLARVELLTLETREGSLDLLAHPPGAPGYDELRREADEIEIEGRAVRIASIEHLLAMKRAAGRPQDLLDIEALEILRARRRRQR
jgi:predicted nucleotidyltransferase